MFVHAQLTLRVQASQAYKDKDGHKGFSGAGAFPYRQQDRARCLLYMKRLNSNQELIYLAICSDLTTKVAGRVGGILTLYL